MAMRKERAERRSQIGRVRLQAESADRSGQMVFEAEDVSKSFGDRDRRSWRVVSRDAPRSRRLDRAERIGQDHAAADADGRARARLRRGAARHKRADRVLRPAARAARPRAHRVRDRRRRQRHRDREWQDAARARVPARFSVSAGARQFAGEGALRRRAEPAAARAAAHAAGERARARRADQRSRSSRRSSCSSRISSTGRARCCSSATTAPSSIMSSRARSSSKGTDACRSTWAATRTG